MPAPTAESDLHAELDQLIDSLADVKRWLRESSYAQRGDHASAALLTLALVDRHGPARVGQLAEWSRVDVSVVSRQAATLEHSGLLLREPDPSDGRAHRLRLTDAGRTELGASRARWKASLAERLAGWEPADLRRFAGDLARFTADVLRRDAG